jgi:hypothetical protein
VSAVYEDQAERRAPVRGERRGVADEGNHDRLQPGPGDGAAKDRQGVDAAVRPEQRRVEVLLPRLLLL